MTRMTQAALANKWDMARMIFRRYLPLMQANFIESNPGPAKAVLISMMGRIERGLSSSDGADETRKPDEAGEDRH